MKGHQYARDACGGWVDARQLAFGRGVRYFCDCPDRHELKHVKSSGSEDKRGFTDYFAHIGQSGGNSNFTCRPGGESLEHRLAKQKLREMVGQYQFAVERCSKCKASKLEDGIGASVTLEVVSMDKKWRYDALMLTVGGLRIVLEIFHKHATGSQKVNSIRRSGLLIAEFRSEDVLEMKSGDILENILVNHIICSGCLLNHAHEWISLCHNEEFCALKQNEVVIEQGYWAWWSLHTERLVLVKRKSEEQASRAKRICHVPRGCYVPRESKWYAGDLSSRWPEIKRYSCESTLNWHADENELLRRNEEIIKRGYLMARP